MRPDGFIAGCDQIAKADPPRRIEQCDPTIALDDSGHATRAPYPVTTCQKSQSARQNSAAKAVWAAHRISLGLRISTARVALLCRPPSHQIARQIASAPAPFWAAVLPLDHRIGLHRTNTALRCQVFVERRIGPATEQFRSPWVYEMDVTS